MMLTACFQFATIPIAELIGTFCFGESLPATALTGMALILVAGCAASVITKQMEKKTEKEGFFRALRLIARTPVRAYASGYFVLFKKFSALNNPRLKARGFLTRCRLSRNRQGF